MKVKFLIAGGIGVASGVWLAADAGRLPGYVAAYSAAAALLILGVSLLVALCLLIPRRTRVAGAAALLAGVAFYATFLLSMNVLDRQGVWAARMVSIGQPTKADLIVLFKKGVDQRLVNNFVETVLSTPDARGGHAHRPGVSSISWVQVADHDAYSVRFWPGATTEQRADIRVRAEKSPIVQRVFENVRIDQIKL